MMMAPLAQTKYLQHYQWLFVPSRMWYLSKCVFSIVLLCLHSVCGQNAKYVIPKVDIDVFAPKGLRASIPDAPNLTLFAFQGQIQRRFEDNSISSTLNGEVHQPSEGRWTFEDNSIQLRVGDVVDYFVIVSVNSDGFVKDNLRYNVTELKDRSGTSTTSVNQSPAEDCKLSATVVNDGSVCAGQVVFEDHFNSFQEKLWQIEHKIPLEHAEFPFISYQKMLPGTPTVQVEDGYLKIKPRLQQTVAGFTNETIYSGVLDLFNGCTGTSHSTCFMQASGANILPPVVSARLISKRFHFKYGIVEVRAKMPQGDWIYPEILLEPFLKKYGSMSYSSGVLKIASARGNKVLYSGSTCYGNEVLYGGALVQPRCEDALLIKKARSDGKMWGDDFHTYSLRWAPDRITLSVDNEEWGRIEPAASGLMGKLPVTCRDTTKMWAGKGKLAPFDEEFYLTLGVAVGGISEFKDGILSASASPKPWRNQASKAKLTFWQDLDAWYPTWTNAELLVDYVKVVAL